MKILYIAFKNFSVLHYGASKKVISACRAMEELGHTVTLIGQSDSNTVFVDTRGACTLYKEHKPFYVKKMQPLFDKWNQIDDICQIIQNEYFDICYIRFDLNTPKFLSLLKALNPRCGKIFIEIPTYPYNKEYSGIINQIRLAIDNLYAKKIYKYVDKIISFYEISGGEYYGVPVQVVPNGFDFDGISIIQHDEVPDTIEIVAVSSMRLWHGYERFIDGLNIYYSNGGKRNLIFHIVGDGREGLKYMELVKRYHLEQRVFFHGAMHGEELDNLMEKCTLGVDSLARHRTGISVLSSLKSREYGAKGIPIINSCDIDILGDDFCYFLKVPADETPINIEDIIEFYDSVYQHGHRIEVARQIRAYIEAKSSMKSVMKMVIEGK